MWDKQGTAKWSGVVAVVLCVMFCRALLAAPPASENAAAFMDQIQKKYSTLHTLEADFVQKLIQGKDQRVESGVLYLSRSARMRWDYTQPERKLFVVDGRTQYTWIPAENRVYREPLKASEDERTPILMLLGRLRWRKVFSRVEQLDNGAGPLTLRAYPKNESQGFQSVTLTVERSTWHLLGIVINNTDQTKMEFSFSHFVENPVIDPHQFTFRIPKGAEVVDQGAM